MTYKNKKTKKTKKTKKITFTFYVIFFHVNNKI